MLRNGHWTTRWTALSLLIALSGGLQLQLTACGNASHARSGPTYALRTTETKGLSTPTPSVPTGANTATASQRADSSQEVAGEPADIEVATWRFGALAGNVIESEHYRIFTTIDRGWARDDLPRFYETALKRYTTAFGDLPMPQRKLESFMFATRDQWQEKAAELLPGQSDAYNNLGRGGLATGGVALLYYIDYHGRPLDTFAIAAHEGWHQYTQVTFRQQLPIWLEEGISAYMEGFTIERDGSFTFAPQRNYERRRALQRAVQADRLIDLQDLLHRSPAVFLQSSKDDLLTYYAQVWGLTRFLVEHDDGRYADDLQRMLLDAAHGRLVEALTDSRRSGRRSGRSRNAFAATTSGAAAIRVYFNEDLAEFEKQYLEFLEAIQQPPRRRPGRRSDNDGE